MQKRYAITAQKRTVTGKKVKQLRKQGVLPAHLYGAGTEPQSLQVDTKDFLSVYTEAGATGLTDLTVEGQVHPVLIQNVQHDFVKRTPVHVDFLQVNLKEKLTAMIPVILEGEPQAVTDKIGILMQVTNEVEVEALPTDLPESFTVDVSHLAAIDEQITIADLKAPMGVVLTGDPTTTIAKITELVAAEPEPEPVAAEGEEGTEGETTEGEAPEGEEGEKSTEESSEGQE